MRIANLLVGNAENAAALEMTLAGATLEFDEESVVALTGGNCDCRINGDTAPMWQAIRVPARGILACGGVKTGARLYLAIQGGMDVQSIMGSASTNMAGHFGGFEGRGLRKGDSLGVRRKPNSRVSTLRARSGRRVIFSRAASRHAWRAARLVWRRSLWQTFLLPLHRKRAIEPLRFAFARANRFRREFDRNCSPKEFRLAQFRCRRMSSPLFSLSISRPPAAIRR